MRKTIVVFISEPPAESRQYPLLLGPQLYQRGQAGKRQHKGADKIFRAQQETIEFVQVMEKEIRKEWRKWQA